jgi:hypothetical protein
MTLKPEQIVKDKQVGLGLRSVKLAPVPKFN